MSFWRGELVKVIARVKALEAAEPPVVPYATSGETDTGTSTTIAVTPKGAADTYVKYSSAQTLTTGQQLQARTNIGATNTPITALPFNYLVNASNEVKQINQTVTTSGAYFVDQWFVYKNFATGAVSVIGNQSTGQDNDSRCQVDVVTAQASIAAGEYLMAPVQKIEGQRLAPLGWGRANGVPIVVCVNFAGPAGTYSLWIRDFATASRNYVASFTISAGQANTATTQIFAVPAPSTSSVFHLGSNASLEIGITLACASNLTAASQGWQTSSFFAAPGQSNGISSAANNFYVWNWGLYADPLGTGLPPTYQKLDYARSLQECQRYYELTGFTVTTTGLWKPIPYKVEKRASPTAFTLLAGNLQGATIAANTNQPTWAMRQTANASLDSDVYIAVDARMP